MKTVFVVMYNAYGDKYPAHVFFNKKVYVGRSGRRRIANEM